MSKQKTDKSKSEYAITSGGIVTVGLDIGYGVTKVVTDQTAIAFPSVAGHAREIKFQQEALAAKYPGDSLQMKTVRPGLSVIWRWHSFHPVNCFGYADAPPTKRRWAIPSVCGWRKPPLANWRRGCRGGMSSICGYAAVCRWITCGMQMDSSKRCWVNISSRRMPAKSSPM